MTLARRIFAPHALVAAILALSLVDMGLRAPVLRADYAPPSGPHLGWARTALDAKAYALAHAWDAVRRGDGAAGVRHAEAALRAGPQDAYAWLARAWAAAQSGDDPGARAALAQSYRLAPRSMPLAQSRVALAQRWWPQMSAADRRALVAETRVARGLDAHAFNLAAAQAPRLAAIHRLGGQ